MALSITPAGGNVPLATSTTPGVVELFSDTVQATAANAVTARASRTYGLQVNSAGQAVVNVPLTPRVAAHTSGTYSLNSNGIDNVNIAPAGNITISVDGGSPSDGQKLIFRITNGATSYNLTFSSGLGTKGFRPVGVTVPATTGTSNIMYVGCIYNEALGVWDIIAYTMVLV